MLVDSHARCPLAKPSTLHPLLALLLCVYLSYFPGVSGVVLLMVHDEAFTHSFSFCSHIVGIQSDPLRTTAVPIWSRNPGFHFLTMEKKKVSESWTFAPKLRG
jgi:hypothetical protein